MGPGYYGYTTYPPTYTPTNPPNYMYTSISSPPADAKPVGSTVNMVEQGPEGDKGAEMFGTYGYRTYYTTNYNFHPA